MSSLTTENDVNDPYYLLGFDREDIDALTDDISQEFTQGNSLPEKSTSSSKGNTDNIIPQPQVSYKDALPFLRGPTTVEKELQTRFTVHESKSINEEKSLLLGTPFSCELICDQHISYRVNSNYNNKSFELKKLDVVLGESSSLRIEVLCTLNGLDILLDPTWMMKAVTSAMEKVEFSHKEQQQRGRTFEFVVQKAFVTTPLSYLLEKQAPHGILENMTLQLDFDTTNGKSKKFAEHWNRESNKEAVLKYVEEALFELLVRRVFQRYPLIFSSFYVKRLAPVISHIPHISQSFYKILKTAKDVSSNQAFVNNMTDKLKRMEENTSVLRPYYTETMNNNQTEEERKLSITTSLTLNMYSTNANEQKKSSHPLSIASASKQKQSPDALEAIGKIWSITCSSAPPSLTD